MESKVKIAELQFLNICIGSIIGTSEKLGGGVLFKLNKTINSIKPHLEAFDTTKKKIVEDHAKKDKKGNIETEKSEEGAEVYVFEDGMLDKAQKEINDVLESEISVEISKIPLSSFESMEFDTSKIPAMNLFMDLMIDEGA